MPLNSESTSTHPRQEFCLALKAARERKGLSLVEIAEATKIPASLFAALERSDLRRWPNGLFRRSFFRDYVRMIGLPVAEACDEFVRLFSDDASGELAEDAEAQPPPDVTPSSPLLAAWQRYAGAIARAFGRSEGSTSEPVKEPEPRGWISDARRVGPAASPRIRVRIKLPQ